MTDAIAAPLSISIPAPRSLAADFIARSAKGELRTDAAAPPTVAANGAGDFSFADLIDIVNPLQHIPGVNLAYRAISGDSIQPTTNMAGGFLYGGPLGALFAIASSVVGELIAASDGTDAAKVADNNAATPDISKSSNQVS